MRSVANSGLGVMAVLSASLAAPAWAEMIPGSYFEHRAWTGAAYVADDGAFTHCAMSADYQSGDTLVLSVGGDASVGIGVVSPRLGMEPGAEYAVSVTVDRRYGSQEIVTARNEDYFVLHLEDFSRALEAMRFGNVLYIQGNGFAGEYNLTGTAVALDQAYQCAVNYLNYRAPVATAPEVADTSFDRTYLFQAATEMISALGLTEFRYFTEAEMREARISQDDVFWYSETYAVMGGVYILPTEGQSLRQLDADDTQYLASFCDGDFASSARDLSNYEVPVREVRLVCAEEGNPHEVFLTKMQIGGATLYSELRFYDDANATSRTQGRSQENELVAARLASFAAD